MSTYSFKIIFILLTILNLLNNCSSQETQTVTANIYADNYFEFYVNGKLVKKDPYFLIYSKFDDSFI